MIGDSLDDIQAVCAYLATKPIGATLAEAKVILDKKRLDGRKINALKFWGLIEDDENKMKITNLGRQCVRDSFAHRSEVLRKVVRHVPPYWGIVERAAHRHEETISATDVAAHWHEHFRSDVADSEKILNDQAVCFFQIAQGADLGTITIGRKGMPTRFDFAADAAQAFVDGRSAISQHELPPSDEPSISDLPEEADRKHAYGHRTAEAVAGGNRVFITHGRNRKILNQVKELVAYGKFEPVVAMEHETAAKPVPKKVMDDMRTCKAAVLHVSAGRVLYEQNGNEVPQINQNVLIEIGAAMALYRDKFVLLVEEGVTLPSNLQGLYECRYDGDELNMPATMKLLKAFSEF